MITKTTALLLLGLMLTPADSFGANGTPTAILPTPSATTQEAKSPAPEPPLFGTVRKLSEAASLEVDGCKRLAEDTLTWGTSQREGRQAFPLGPVNDALEAVSLGEKLDAKAAAWPTLREQLQQLLQPAQKDQEQKKQDKDNQDKQDKDKKEEKKEQEQKQGEKQDPANKDKNEPQDKSGQPPPEQKQEPQDKQEAGKQTPPDKQDAFGKMQQQQQQQPPPAPQEEMHQVGGAPAEKQNVNEDPNLVVPLEKMQKLKSQDNPGRLFELMQDEKKQTPPANKKNW